MLLAIDAGNTNIVFALYGEDNVLYCVWRCQTESRRTADEYQSWLIPLFMKVQKSWDQITEVVICSVVPDIDFHLVNLCHSMFQCDPLMVSHDTVDFKIGLDKVSEIGADRLVNALTVIREGLAPAIIIDFGTATTFDVINMAGVYSGGVIAPGIHLSMEALYQAAAKLPRVKIEKPSSVIGTDTVSAIQSGLYWGYVGMIEGTLQRMKMEMKGKNPVVIATGGLAPLFADTIEMITKADHDLTLRGLLYVARGTEKTG